MEPVNLNKARKARAQAQARAEAAANRAKFGRSKAQKTLERQDSERARRELDGAKRADD